MRAKSLLVAAALAMAVSMPSWAQLGRCKGKYLGNIIAYQIPSNYTTLWNQVTSENGSKWGSCDKGNGVYDFGNTDLAYNWAKTNSGMFKFHTLTWGGQAPGYLKTASAADIATAIRKWYQAVYDHYTPMGGLKMIDVLNEPVNTPLTAELANLKAALTLGYQSEPANAGDLNNPYGYAIWPYQLARKLFPNTVLLINEYNVEFNWNNCRATYIAMINAIKSAPNLTDGKKNLIDGIGLQAHGMNGANNNLSTANFKACLDELWTKTGLPIHMTELDIVADPNEAAQATYLQNFFTAAWEHPHVAGITLWGYIQGSTWIPGNKVAGTGGTDSGLQYADLTDRPAMKWLKSYMAAQTSLACCPAPAPFGNCANGASPTVSITAPVSPAAYSAPAAITLTATAADADGTISSVKFYNGANLLATVTTAPYTYSWTNAAVGTYSITAVATDNSSNTTTSDPVAIKVNVAQAAYNGTPSPIPGTIQFENYDVGGNGFAYLDNAVNNTGGATFRTDEDVDIENCTDAGTGYNIGYATAGEWLEYTVNVAAAGNYNFALRVACNADTRTVSLSSDGTSLAKDIAIPNTAGWQTWTTVNVPNIALKAGVQVIRITIGATDYVNLNYMTITGPPAQTIKLKAGWNLVGCPIDGSTDVDKAMSSIWTNVTSVKDMTSFYLNTNAAALNSLTKLDWGKGYMVKVKADCELDWIVR